MKTNYYILLCMILSYMGQSFGQTPVVELPICASEQINQATLIQDKDYAKEQRLFEVFYQKQTREKGLVAEKTNMLYTIPTVVHIVHNCAELGTINNPDDDQIRAIMTELNQRFAHNHTGAQTYSNTNYGIDTEIEFCLVDADPSGNYTTGIVRHADSDNHIGSYSQLRAAYGSAYRWDRTKYFNIFIATDLTDASGVYLGGSSADFIICDAPAFEPGLVAHEAGHYFSLKHTFGTCGNGNCLADGDFVCDTPPKSSSGLAGGICEAPNNSCFTDDDDTATYNPYRPSNIGGMGDQLDMLENYMDYTSSCWDAFTLGQKNRMRLNIESSRLNMVNSSNTVCTGAAIPNLDIAVTRVTTNLADCTSSFAPSVTFNNEGTVTITSATIEIMNAGTSSSLNWTGSLAPNASISVSMPDLNLVAGINTITAVATSPNGTSSEVFTNNNEACTTVAYPSPTGLDLPFFDDFSSCALNPFYNLDNGGKVLWSLTNYSTPSGLTNCQDCYTRVLGFATPAETAQFCLPKFDFSTAAGPTIQFLMGHIPRYAFISDQLNINVSKNCGTPSTVWSSSALQLATNTPSSYSPNSAYLYPICNEMQFFEVDLSDFALETNVEICFEASGRWYSPLILDELNVQDNSTKHIAIKAMLNGPYDSGTGLMDAKIRQLSNFPLTEPYTSMGYQYVGGGNETININILYVNDENAIVDWVILEVRDPIDPSKIISSRAALIQRDGDVVDLDGSSAVQMTGVVSGNYHVAIRHRNHLGTMTALVNIQ